MSEIDRKIAYGREHPRAYYCTHSGLSKEEILARGHCTHEGPCPMDVDVPLVWLLTYHRHNLQVLLWVALALVAICVAPAAF